MTALQPKTDSRGHLHHGANHAGPRNPGRTTVLDRKGGRISVEACERAVKTEAETAAALLAQRMGSERYDNRSLSQNDFMSALREVRAESSY